MKKPTSIKTLFLMVMLLLSTGLYGFFLPEAEAQEKDLQQPPVLQGLSGTKVVTDRQLKPVTPVRIPTYMIQKKLLPQLIPVAVPDP
ncbi:MAG: hypothetical protein PHU03_06725, partial [Syntrophales bacterium]|nr:hypothetical protein [Syntrophales bacterium]